MNGLEGIMRTVNLARQFESQLGPAFALMKQQKSWQNELGILNVRDAVLKGLAMPNKMTSPFIKYQLTENTLMKLHESLLPPTLSSTLDSITNNYYKTFQSLKMIADLSPRFLHTHAQVNNIKFVLNGLSGRMATIAAVQRQWDLFDDLNVITEKVSEFVEEFENNRSWTDQTKAKLLTIFNETKNLCLKNKKVGAKVILILSTLAIPMGYHQYFDFLKVKPEAATKEELRAFRQEVKKDINDIATEYSRLFSNVLREEYKITNRKCKVMLKPSNKSFAIAIIPKGFDLIVIQNHHEWAYVKFFNPEDNLPQTGWVLKKYLTACE